MYIQMQQDDSPGQLVSSKMFLSLCFCVQPANNNESVAIFYLVETVVAVGLSASAAAFLILCGSVPACIS